MDEKKIKNEEIEIDLQRLFRALMKRAGMICLTAVCCAAIAFAVTFFFITPMYQSSAMFHVNNSAQQSNASSTISSADISASRGLVKSYIVILNTRETLNEVIEYAGVDRTYSEVARMITAESVDSTEIFRVVVTSPDPKEAEQIANAVAHVLPLRITSIIEGSSARVVDYAVQPKSPSSPSYFKNLVIGFVLGLFMACAVVVLRELLDITIKTEEDVSHSCSYPILAAVPDMEAKVKGGSYYGYGRAYSRAAQKNSKQTEIVGNISFAAAEAYKLLRTKLQFSFADGGACRVVGLSSAMAGEGKSVSAVNLAYSLSQLGERVLLIDCDMRRPSITQKLPVEKTPGLSDYLTGQSQSDYLIQYCGLKDDEKAFHVISAGRNPPNPMELLSSARMEKMIELLRKRYDYIILDLPPVGEVGDALAAAKLTDGLLVVVRQNYCDRISLNAAIRQFEFVDCKVLGIVLNCVTESGGSYSKRYYKQYNKQYNNNKAYSNAYRKNRGSHVADPRAIDVDDEDDED